jgi:hypothetical protein
MSGSSPNSSSATRPVARRLHEHLDGSTDLGDRPAGDGGGCLTGQGQALVCDGLATLQGGPPPVARLRGQHVDRRAGEVDDVDDVEWPSTAHRFERRPADGPPGLRGAVVAHTTPSRDRVSCLPSRPPPVAVLMIASSAPGPSGPQGVDSALGAGGPG